jgi:3-keto-disaccharide hydrolase
MHRSVPFLLSLVLLAPMASRAQTNAFAGRWDFDVPTPHNIGANWLGISEKNGQLDIWFQPTGGHVYEVKDYKLDGPHLTLTVSPAHGNHPATIWELDASNGKLTGTQKQGDKTIALTGLPAPALNRRAPAAWTQPEPLFNGRDLQGWQPIGDTAHNNWVVEDGELVNKAHGANLETTRKFNDFKLHFEVNCPNDGNSGFYLRGRYELQIEYEPGDRNPPNRRIGSIYGRITPAVELAPKPGQWETFDVTLVGRTVTVVRDGKTTIDHQQIDGITGGALNADEGEPGPFYIQGDHTGGLKFRDITVSVPKS